MGSLVEFRRKPPALRFDAKPAPQAASDELTSLRILLWTFALAAIAMCVTVVACFSNSWSDLLWISGFVLVFALAKIGLANWLFWIMIKYDRDNRPAPRPPRLVPPPDPLPARAPRIGSAARRRRADRRFNPVKTRAKPQAPGATH